MKCWVNHPFVRNITGNINCIRTAPNGSFTLLDFIHVWTLKKIVRVSNAAAWLPRASFVSHCPRLFNLHKRSKSFRAPQVYKSTTMDTICKLTELDRTRTFQSLNLLIQSRDNSHKRREVQRTIKVRKSRVSVRFNVDLPTFDYHPADSRLIMELATHSIRS